MPWLWTLMIVAKQARYEREDVRREPLQRERDEVRPEPSERETAAGWRSRRFVRR
jgi:hypothetical protein